MRSPSSSTSSSSNYTISHTPSSASPMPYHSYAPSSRQESQDALVSCLLQILEQPLSMLRDGTVSDEQMGSESALIPGSSVGKHLRHVHDHYRLLLDAIEDQLSSSSSSAPSPSSSSQAALPSSSSSSSKNASDSIKLDYDKRMRSPPLETSVSAALSEFEETQGRIKHLFAPAEGELNAPRMDQRLDLTATTPAEVELGSTLGREMWFCCLHAIHHYALARVILTHELGLSIADSFGVAPSTMVFRIWGRSKL